MEFLTFAVTLYRGVQTVRSLTQLMEETLAPTLRAVGDIHFSAAAQALEDMKLSTQPSRELGIAIGHLGAAYKAFESIRWPTEEGHDYVKCIGALSTIAVCYKYSGDTILMVQYLDKAGRVMSRWCEACNTRYRRASNRDGGLVGMWLGIIWPIFRPYYMTRHQADHEAWNQFNAACRAN